MSIVSVTPEEVERLYEKVEWLPAYSGPDNASRFRRLLHAAWMVLELPFGIIRITDYKAGLSVQAHGIFWSKEVFRGTDALVDMTKLVMGLFEVKSVEIAVPSGSRGLARLMERLPYRKVATLQDFFFNDILKIPADLYVCTKEDMYG
jgi:hypothetical protein